MEATICEGCHEAVTNPVCSSCLGKEIEFWLANKSQSLVEEFLAKSMEFEELGLEDDLARCIICKEKMSLCTYCYTEFIYYWLKDSYPELISEYMKYFNFDLSGKGYKADARRSGLI